jgi:Ca2+-binding RTX toxin-like protein
MTIPVDSSWTLTFDEEFNGTSLDTDVWGTNWLGADGATTPPINDAELAAYDPDNVSVSDGMLHLTASDTPATVDGTQYDYTSGIVQTHDSFSQTYGYFEARIYLPGTDGEIDNWPAFWTDGENWPEDGEMDIMEGLGGDAAYHFHSPEGGPGEHVEGDYTGWHTFGAQWEPGQVSFYYDDEYVGSIETGITDSPMYLILNNGVGGYGGDVSAPSDMLVDWVHVYSADPDAVAVAPQAGYDGPGGTEEPQAGTTPPPPAGEPGDGAVPTPDLIAGTNGNDTLEGTGDDETLDGHAGADVLIGGSGNDTYIVDNTGDSVQEAQDAGTDLVKSSVSFTLTNTYIENLTLTGQNAINGEGSSGANVLVGNDGVNHLDGRSGADTLESGGGNDTLTGGAGDDTFVFLDDGGADTITDYNDSHDVIDLTALTDVHSFSDLDVTNDDGMVVVDYGTGSITLANVQASWISAIEAGDFLFA